MAYNTKSDTSIHKILIKKKKKKNGKIHSFVCYIVVYMRYKLQAKTRQEY